MGGGLFQKTQDRDGTLSAFSALETSAPGAVFRVCSAGLSVEPCRGSAVRVQMWEETLLPTCGVSGGAGRPGLEARRALPRGVSHGKRRQKVRPGPGVSL